MTEELQDQRPRVQEEKKNRSVCTLSLHTESYKPNITAHLQALSRAIGPKTLEYMTVCYYHTLVADENVETQANPHQDHT